MIDIYSLKQPYTSGEINNLGHVYSELNIAQLEKNNLNYYKNCLKQEHQISLSIFELFMMTNIQKFKKTLKTF